MPAFSFLNSENKYYFQSLFLSCFFPRHLKFTSEMTFLMSFLTNIQNFIFFLIKGLECVQFSCWDCWRLGQSSQARFSRRPRPPVASSPDCQRLGKGQSLFSRSPAAHSAFAVAVAGDGAHAQHPELLAVGASLAHFANHDQGL